MRNYAHVQQMQRQGYCLEWNQAGYALQFSIWLQPLRKSLLAVAGIASATSALLSVGAAKAQMFNVTASSPGAINFSGTGTANFNNSLGTSNSFQVGSSTNLGVNASTSATPDYKVTSQADLQLSSGTTLKQNIGTSGLYNTSTSTVEAATTAAATISNDQASKAMSSSGWTGSWQNDGEYDSTTKQYTKGSGATAVSWSNQSEYEQKYQSEYNREYNSTYQTNFNNAYSQTQTKSAASGTDGVISGSFKTVESGTARAGGTATDWSKTADTAATTKAEAGFESWKLANNKSNAQMSEYKASSEYSSSYNTEFNSAYAQASAASNRYSDSSVTVKGIGSGATVAASSMSNFTVDIGAGTGATGSTGTANGSAGANLATSSFANQSNSSTASAFMQAFGAGGNVSSGTTTEKGTLTTTTDTTFKADPVVP